MVSLLICTNIFLCRTALHLAAATGNDEITKFLLVNKAKTNLCDNDGRTALMKVSYCLLFISNWMI